MEILGIALLVPLGGITIIALFGAVNLLLPVTVEKISSNLENSLGRSLLIGVVNFIFFGVLALALFWLSEQSGKGLRGLFIFLAGIILVGIAIVALFGLSAFAKLIGERIGGRKTPFTSDLRGGALLLLAALAPYIGWFIFTPLVLWAGFGASISAILRKDKEMPSQEE